LTHHSRSLAKKPAYFFIGDLRKIYVPRTDAAKRLRHCQHDQVVNESFERGAGVGRSYGYRNDNRSRRAFAQRKNCGVHACAGRESVVDQNHRAMTHIVCAQTAAICILAPLQFAHLAPRDLLDNVRRHAEKGYRVLVEHAHAAGRDGAHPELLAAGRADFPYDENVERRAQYTRDFITDRHPAAGKRQDACIASGVRGKPRRQSPARIAAVFEDHWLSVSPAGGPGKQASMNDRSDKKELTEDDPRSREQRIHKDRDNEQGAPMAPSQNRPPAEQHRSGPLPNQKK
jgi:hypothetical protein